MMLWALLLIGAVGLGVLVAGSPLVRRSSSLGDSDNKREQITYLGIGLDQTNPDAGAEWATLFAFEPDTGVGFGLFVPTTTLAEIPGHAFEGLGKAYTYGGAALEKITVGNVLGVAIDGTATFDRPALAAFVDALGGLQVNVPARLNRRLAGGGTETAFEAGPQHLDGARVVELLNFRAEGQSELDRFPRAQAVWEAVFARERAAAGSLEAGLDRADVPDKSFAALLASLARLEPGNTMTFQSLPVRSVGSGGDDEVYQPDKTAVRSLVRAHLAASVPSGGAGVGLRVQLLNGNGIPGIGAGVAEQLQPAGFRIVLSDNAPNFEYAQTAIVVYSEDKAILAAARRIRDILKVGHVEVSRLGQSVVDITVVIGKDYPPG